MRVHNLSPLVHRLAVPPPPIYHPAGRNGGGGETEGKYCDRECAQARTPQRGTPSWQEATAVGHHLGVGSRMPLASNQPQCLSQSLSARKGTLAAQKTAKGFYLTPCSGTNTHGYSSKTLIVSNTQSKGTRQQQNHSKPGVSFLW